jgi:prolyl-tRNA synthetase
MYDNALKNVEENTRIAKDYDEFKEIMDKHQGYVKMMWCGDEACENQIKEETKATSRCMPFDQTPVGDECPVCHKKAKHVVYYAKAY